MLHYISCSWSTKCLLIVINKLAILCPLGLIAHWEHNSPHHNTAQLKWVGWLHGFIVLHFKNLNSLEKERTSSAFITVILIVLDKFILSYNRLKLAQRPLAQSRPQTDRVLRFPPVQSSSLMFYLPLTTLRSSTGLQAQCISTAEMEWPPSGLQRIPRWLPRSGSIHVGLYLETWFILCKRERSQFPRGHHW